jgi:hypothetical protein
VHCVGADAVEAGWKAEVGYLEADDFDIVDCDFGYGAHGGGGVVVW